MSGAVPTDSQVAELEAAVSDAKWRRFWAEPKVAGDPRIDHENPLVRLAARSLHANESLHLHDNPGEPCCVYCALRSSRVLREAKLSSRSCPRCGDPLRYDPQAHPHDVALCDGCETVWTPSTGTAGRVDDAERGEW